MRSATSPPPAANGGNCRGISRPISTVRGYFYHWIRDGRREIINHALVMASREKVGRKPRPTAGVIDSQSVKTTESGGPHA